MYLTTCFYSNYLRPTITLNVVNETSTVSLLRMHFESFSLLDKWISCYTIRCENVWSNPRKACYLMETKNLVLWSNIVKVVSRRKKLQSLIKSEILHGDEMENQQSIYKASTSWYSVIKNTVQQARLLLKKWKQTLFLLHTCQNSKKLPYQF